MERFQFLVLIFIFKFENLTILIFLFLSHFGFRVFHERCFVIVVDERMCGLKKIQIFVCLVIDIYDFFFCTWSMKNNVKIQI
jgi:hypothetical protein